MAFEKRSRKIWKQQTKNRRKHEQRKRRKERRNIVKVALISIFCLAIMFTFLLALKQNIEVSYAKQLYLVEPNIGSITVTVTPEYILLAEHSIDNSNSSEDRNWNMELVADILNKKIGIVMPGEVFSYLEVVGDTTPEKGFRLATVINNGMHDQDYGGGVCQVTSTMNSALAKAGLDTNAVAHSISSRYIVPERGDKEAAVSYSSGTDFSFKNTTHNPLKMLIIVEGGTVTVKVYKIQNEIEIEYRKN